MNLGVLISALIAVESGGNWRAHNSEEHAGGGLQIRPIMVRDIRRVAPDLQFTLADRWIPSKATEGCRRWLLSAGEYYHKSTGNHPTYEVYARLWNSGWYNERRGFPSSTDEYWRKVQHELNRRSRSP